jgi:hypothetical protein
MNDRLKGLITNPFTLFLTAWAIINLFQARLTPLNNDEAYYWMYSGNLAWGYFDHPPMIALMIKIGYFFIKNELGVRIVVVLSQLLTLWIMWLLTDRPEKGERNNILMFFMLVVLLPVFNIYSYFATPDAPLILFAAVFLLTYKNFLAEDSWKNALLMGIAIAALMYSKYHSGLLIILVILSNPRLLLNVKLYAAGLLAFMLFFPHLFWQYSSDFPSFKYHLVERVSHFNPAHVPQYIVGQYFFHNPLIFTLLIWIMIKVRTRDLFNRALYFIIAGFFLFFFISSFRYRVEPQWNAVVCVPMVIILFNNLSFRPWIKNYLKWVTIVLFPLLLFARIACAIDFLPLHILKIEFHNKKQWVKDISNLAGDRPVVFTNSYQRPAVYTFYSGKPAYTLDNLNYRKTQYDIWPYEEMFHGKEVLYVPHFFNEYYRAHLTKHILTNGDSLFVTVFKNFQSLQKECVILKEDQYSFTTKESNTIHLEIYNPYPYSIDFKHKELPVVFQLAFIKKGYMEIKKNLEIPGDITQMKTGDTLRVDCSFTLEDLSPGEYKIAVCTETGILYDTYNSKFIPAKVRE